MRTYPKNEITRKAIQVPYDKKGCELFLKDYLQKYLNKTFYCKVLGVPIKVDKNSIKETAFNASLSRKSTKVAMHLPYIVRNAHVIELNLPTESKTQKTTFYFKNIAILRCNVPRVGIAKLVIGCRKNGKVLEYSITDYQACRV